MNSARRCAILAAVAAIALSTPAPGRAGPTAYARMAPIGQYVTAHRQAEVDFARSAGPPALSNNATILTLTTRGYVVAAKGTNGFTCLVERSWSGPINNPEFWNPKIRGPVCYNAAASRSVLKYSLFRTNQALLGTSQTDILARAKAAVAAGKLPLPSPGAMAYMMSKRQYLSDALKAAGPHLMIFVSKANRANGGASWGANAKGSPVLIDPTDDSPEPMTVFFIPVSHWSDGSKP